MEMSRLSLLVRHISDKIRSENQNTHFMFNNFFPKIVPFLRKYGKMCSSQTGHTRQYGACALHAGYLRLQTLTESM